MPWFSKALVFIFMAVLRMIEIEKIQNTVYALMHSDFNIRIENGVSFPLRFRQFHFFHLLGFHYLTDLPNISQSKRKEEVIKRFLKNGITLADLRKSKHFHKIEKRLESFDCLADMLINGNCKIIIDFDPSLVNKTLIHSKYILYITDDYNTYKLFGVARAKNGEYYPETFFVESSKYYITGQNLLSCSITCIEHKSNELVGAGY